jgi:hypothetical protein
MLPWVLLYGLTRYIEGIKLITIFWGILVPPIWVCWVCIISICVPLGISISDIPWYLKVSSSSWYLNTSLCNHYVMRWLNEHTRGLDIRRAHIYWQAKNWGVSHLPCRFYVGYIEMMYIGKVSMYRDHDDTLGIIMCWKYWYLELLGKGIVHLTVSVVRKSGCIIPEVPMPLQIQTVRLWVKIPARK